MFFRFFLQHAIYAFYYLCYKCVKILDFVYAKLILRSRRQLTTESARQKWILWRKKISNGLEHSPADFLCAFSSPVTPEYVLQPTVSLYAITDKEAVFVETPETINIYSPDVYPFFCIAQFIYAMKVIKLSIKDFVTLAEKIEDPSIPVIWLSTTGRCGGTMLCQVFESVPGTLAITEPYSPLNLCNLLENQKQHVSEYKNLLKSIVRVLCKPHPCVQMVTIKSHSKCTMMMTDISKVCPYIKQIFVYRNSKETILSFLAIIMFEQFGLVLWFFD